MGQLMYMSEARLKRALKRGDARVLIDNRGNAVESAPWHLRGVLFWINVGVGLTPRAPVTFTAEGWSAPVVIKGEHVHLVVPWRATASVDSMSPPPQGGRPIRAAA